MLCKTIRYEFSAARLLISPPLLILRLFSGDEVDWVQCDKCELWFHLTCLGLNKNDVSEDDDFVCMSCKSVVASNMAAGDSVSSKVVAAESEEIISVVSTPVPSASQSPINDVSVNQSGDTGGRDKSSELMENSRSGNDRFDTGQLGQTATPHTS